MVQWLRENLTPHFNSQTINILTDFFFCAPLFASLLPFVAVLRVPAGQWFFSGSCAPAVKWQPFGCFMPFRLPFPFALKHAWISYQQLAHVDGTPKYTIRCCEVDKRSVATLAFERTDKKAFLSLKPALEYLPCFLSPSSAFFFLFCLFFRFLPWRGKNLQILMKLRYWWSQMNSRIIWFNSPLPCLLMR